MSMRLRINTRYSLLFISRTYFFLSYRITFCGLLKVAGGFSFIKGSTGTVLCRSLSFPFSLSLPPSFRKRNLKPGHPLNPDYRFGCKKEREKTRQWKTGTKTGNYNPSLSEQVEERRNKDRRSTKNVKRSPHCNDDLSRPIEKQQQHTSNPHKIIYFLH